MKPQSAPNILLGREVSTRSSRSQSIIAVAVFAVLVSSAVTSCTRTQVALSSAGIAAVVVGTTVGVTLAIQHSRHTLQGCIVSDGDGLKLRLTDARLYTLKGEVSEIKSGEKLKLHGSRVKKVNGYPAGDQVFVVEKVNKDYGPCPGKFATSPAP